MTERMRSQVAEMSFLQRISGFSLTDEGEKRSHFEGAQSGIATPTN